MPDYRAPGVYVEEVDRGPKPIEGVSTSTAGFLGETERGETDPKLVTSFADFERTFGGYALYRSGGRLEGRYLAYAVDGFFRNGGNLCYVGRITNETEFAETDLSPLGGAGGDPAAARVTALGPGVWGNNVAVVVEDGSLYQEDANQLFKLRVLYWSEVSSSEDEVPDSYEALVDAYGEPDLEEVYDNLSPDETSSDYVEQTVNDASNLVEVERLTDTRPAPTVQFLEIPADGGGGGGGGGDGGGGGGDDLDGEFEVVPDGGAAALTADDFVGSKTVNEETGEKEATGLSAFEDIDDISIVCVPAEVDVDGLTDEVVTHCETMKDRFAVLQAAESAGDISDVQPMRGDSRLDSTYAAYYYPWVKVRDPVTNMKKLVPPGGHVTGVYARSDSQRGVHKAPANETVRGATELQLNVTQREQEVLNPKGVNVIRNFPARGIRVWGARTTSSDGSWKYVNVRRLFLYLEESIDEGTQWVVFEPNDETLWARVRQSVGNFLTTAWRNGALMGTTAEEAFYVKCDRSTMTQDDIDNGRLICEIGVAPVKPAEFVVFRISQWTGGAEGS